MFSCHLILYHREWQYVDYPSRDSNTQTHINKTIINRGIYFHIQWMHLSESWTFHLCRRLTRILIITTAIHISSQPPLRSPLNHVRDPQSSVNPRFEMLPSWERRVLLLWVMTWANPVMYVALLLIGYINQTALSGHWHARHGIKFQRSPKKSSSAMSWQPARASAS